VKLFGSQVKRFDGKPQKYVILGLGPSHGLFFLLTKYGVLLLNSQKKNSAPDAVFSLFYRQQKNKSQNLNTQPQAQHQTKTRTPFLFWFCEQQFGFLKISSLCNRVFSSFDSP
jgi:hypothetical protein